jgi:hypothetical protein
MVEGSSAEEGRAEAVSEEGESIGQSCSRGAVLQEGQSRRWRLMRLRGGGGFMMQFYKFSRSIASKREKRIYGEEQRDL